MTTRIIAKKVNGQYLLNFYGQDVEINGERYKSVDVVYTKQEPKTVFVIKERNRISHYISGSEVMQTDVYLAKINELKAKGRECDCETEFENLEDEFEYRKFIKTWIPEYIKEEIKEEIEIVIHDIQGRTDNKYIIPFRFIGKEELEADKVLYRYKPNPYEMLQAVTKEFGLEEVRDIWGENTVGYKWSIPDHSKDNLDFVKINGKYCRSQLKDSCLGITCGSWEECESQYNRHMGVIRSCVREEVAKLNAKGKGIDVADTVRELEIIMASIHAIDPKSKSWRDKETALGKINILKDKLLVQPTNDQTTLTYSS